MRFKVLIGWAILLAIAEVLVFVIAVFATQAAAVFGATLLVGVGFFGLVYLALWLIRG
jgi:hypothetical protein